MIEFNTYKNHYIQLGNPIIGGQHPENMESVNDFYNVVQLLNSQNILEIGFNNGGSALSFLLSNQTSNVCSLDVHFNEQSVKYLLDTFNSRFKFFHQNSGEILNTPDLTTIPFDLIFIDGDHGPEGFNRDVDIAKYLKIPYILFDDTEHPGHINIIERVNAGIVNNEWTVVGTYQNKMLVKQL